MGVCMYRFCNKCLCVCVGFVMFACVCVDFVTSGCFDNCVHVL